MQKIFPAVDLRYNQKMGKTVIPEKKRGRPATGEPEPEPAAIIVNRRRAHGFRRPLTPEEVKAAADRAMRRAEK